MNYQLLFLLVAAGVGAITFIMFESWRRPYRLLFLLTAFSLSASAQNWSTFIDPSRAIDWSGAGFTVPNYTVNCSKQPSLSTGSGAASANGTAITNALASCDATHNVVNLPAGTYYVNSVSFGSQGKQVLRGAGPNSTYLYVTNNIQMWPSNWAYNGSSSVLSGGTQQCLWSAGYAKGTTSITLSSCGGAPPVNSLLILDQANDSKDTNGVYVCDVNIANCGYEGSTGGNNNGRFFGGSDRSQQQTTYVTGVTSLGGGSYTVTISPGVDFSNIRSSQSPGAWWPGMIQNTGIENITLDGSGTSNDDLVTLFDCYQCWVQNTRFIKANRAHIFLYQTAQSVIRNNYFYQANSHYSQSYTIEFEEASGNLIENNIFQQVTTPWVINAGTGNVVGYNLAVDNIYTGSSGYAVGGYLSHSAGNGMNLFEGNNVVGIWGDDAWGASNQSTLFRNMMAGWQTGTTTSTNPVLFRSYLRAMNLVGNVMGQPGYHNQYQTYATSTSAGTGGAGENTSIYTLGWASGGGTCSWGTVLCDPKVFTTLMRWGNYDTVTAGVKWDSTEASPAAATYVGANFSSSYFGSLAHTLPASLYHNASPSWWPSGKAWPAVGPDVSSGNVGVCTGTYAGAQAASSSQCTGGTLSNAWASHVNSIPAQDCFLNVMHGKPDGTGNVLSFDAGQCYTSSGTQSGTGPSSPTGLTAAVI